MQIDVGDLRIRTMELNIGDEVPSHRHNFQHTTICKQGGVRLDMPGETVVLRARDLMSWCLVPAGIEHLIVALEDGTQVLCVYPHRNEAGEIVPTNVGFEPGYF